jgi:hypothetical protein
MAGPVVDDGFDVGADLKSFTSDWLAIFRTERGGIHLAEGGAADYEQGEFGSHAS